MLIALSFHRQKRAEECLCEQVVSNTSNDDSDEFEGGNNTSNDDNGEIKGGSNESYDDKDESGGLSNTRGNGEDNALNYDCDESGGENSNDMPLGALQVDVSKAPAERRAINPQEHIPIEEHFYSKSQTTLLPVSLRGANVRL